MPALTQLLSIELGHRCNLGEVHSQCPNMHPHRWTSLDTSQELSDEAIVDVAGAFVRHGFTGLIAWHYYCEPLMQQERMFALMKRINRAIGHDRFLLWTNGTLLPDDLAPFAAFEQIHVTAYGDVTVMQRANVLREVCAHVIVHHNGFDSRLAGFNSQSPARCLRPFTEFVVDAFGNVHLCCYDWRGLASPGNIFTTPIDRLIEKWQAIRATIVGQTMSTEAPEACRRCRMRTASLTAFDEVAKARAEHWLSEVVKC
jgi:sulfatase maturation enzyme AslB (radical SAM superfamily)